MEPMTTPKYNILCFGDSNTHGSRPGGGRWGRYERWTGVLQLLLGPEYYIIEEGMGGRTTVFEDPVELDRNGRVALPIALHTHQPLDLVIIMLGTNDCKHRLSALPHDIAQGMGELARGVFRYFMFSNQPMPKVLLVSPIHIGEQIEDSVFTCFTKEAIGVSKQLAPLIKKEAETLGCEFFDAASVAKPSQTDQLHMDKEDHEKLARALANEIHRILD